MLKTIKWPIVACGFLLCVIFGLTGCNDSGGSDSSINPKWSFVMLGDTRGDSNTDTGISPYLNAIALKIALLNPQLVVLAGDLCNGDSLAVESKLYPADGDFTSIQTKVNTYDKMFTNWKTAMQPVFNYSTGKGIPVYTIRGNHENEDKGKETIPVLKQAYQEAFSAYLPSNGPNNGPDDDERGFSWSLTQKNVTFVAADQYFHFDPTFANGTTPWSGYHDLDRTWVTQQFKQSKSPYKIFMAHEPIFQVEGNDPLEIYNEGAQHFFGVDAAGLNVRKDFWNNIGATGVQLYLTGHLHLLTVASIKNDYSDTIIQLTAGNGGAPPQPFNNNPEPAATLLYENGNRYINGKVNATVGFSLATVTDDKMIIQYYALNTTDMTWSVAGYSTQILPKASN